MTDIQIEIDTGLENIYLQIATVHESTQRGESGCKERATLSMLECRQAALVERQSRETDDPLQTMKLETVAEPRHG